MLQESKGHLRRISCPEFDAVESPIDTQYFGIPSAKILLRQACASVQQQEELLHFMQIFEFNMITNQANNPAHNHWLGEKTTAFLTDINVQFEKKVTNPETTMEDVTFITDSYPGDEQIIQIAGNSFAVSRFLNDPYLPGGPAGRIYADITKNAFGKPGRFFVIHSTHNLISGFLLFSASGVASTIELIAIDQNFKGRGVGKSLLRAMEEYVSQRSIETIQVGTQLANKAALKFYMSYGFSLKECNSIYHYWPSKS